MRLGLGWTRECDRDGNRGRVREWSGGGRVCVMGMVAEGGGGRVGATGTELEWAGECDRDGGGGHQSWRHMKGPTCTSRSLLGG